MGGRSLCIEPVAAVPGVDAVYDGNKHGEEEGFGSFGGGVLCEWGADFSDFGTLA